MQVHRQCYASDTQTATFVVFAATFAIAMNDFKDLTWAAGRECSNCNILSFYEFSSQIGRLQVTFRESSKSAAEVGGSDVLSKIITPVMSLAAWH